MSTGLFFGTFNPVHRGHEALASSFLSSGVLEELWVILTPSPPHKHVPTLAPFDDRWNMLKLVFSGYPKLHLSDIEQRIPSPHYTVKTITFLKNSYPDRHFYLCIGADTLQTMASWYEVEKMVSKVELLVAGRPGSSVAVPSEMQPFVVHQCKHEETDISSTQIRKSISEGREPGQNMLHPEVRHYIREHRLYGSAGPVK
ncbi:MAG: nicotinate (nicotinamide) nucleotide adenylyltransferase [Balneolales bacterium]